jgi:hypothetical protein
LPTTWRLGRGESRAFTLTMLRVCFCGEHTRLTTVTAQAMSVVILS